MVFGFGGERYVDPKRKAWIRKRPGQKCGTDAPPASDPNANYGITARRPGPGINGDSMLGEDGAFRGSQTRPRASTMNPGPGGGTLLSRPSMGQGSRRESVAAGPPMVSTAVPGRGTYERTPQGSRRPSMAPVGRPSMNPRQSGGAFAPALSQGSRRESMGGFRPGGSRAPGPRASGDPYNSRGNASAVNASRAIYETPVGSGSRR